jgi:hypothetical protein
MRLSLGAPRIGVDIGSRAVRAVLVRRGRPVDAQTVVLDEDDSLDAALASVLRSLAPRALRKPVVFAAIGPSASQLRQLVNLPAVGDARALREVVRGSTARFFLKNGVPLITSSVRREEDGTAWAAALEEPAVRAVAAACKAVRLPLVAIVPSVVALMDMSSDDEVIALDGDVMVELRIGAEGALHGVRRGMVPTSSQTSARVPTTVGAAGSLGTLDPEYAAAYGATSIDPREPLALHTGDLRPWRDTAVPRWRLVLAGTVLIITTLLSVTLPALFVRREAARGRARLATLDPAYRAARWVDQDLAATSSALAQIATFDRSRRSATGFIGQLTDVLPDDAWLQSVHLEEPGGSMTAVAPHASEAFAALSELRAVTTPAIVGAVSAEPVGPQRFERVTLRFRWRSPKEGAENAKASRGRR